MPGPGEGIEEGTKRHHLPQTAVSAGIASLCLAALGYTCADFSESADSDASASIATVTVEPPSATIPVGSSVQFSVASRDAAGAVVSGSFDWSASGGSITPAGLYTAGGVLGAYRVIVAESVSGIADTAGVTVTQPGGTSNRLAASVRDAHYFTGADGRPLFLLGHADCPDWFKSMAFVDDLKESHERSDLSYACVRVPFMSSTGPVIIQVYERAGPGTANDGKPKFDLTRISNAFIERLRDVATWAEANNVYLQISIFAGTTFKAKSGSLWNWEGAVFNPANRINPEADNLVATNVGHPNMNDLFHAGAGWRSEADRRWVRDRCKIVVDQLLRTLAPYRNWWIEIGNENSADATFKRYWAHYIRGEAHSIDDGAVSLYASADHLVGDNSDFGGDVVSGGYVESQQIHLVEAGNAAARSDALYGDGILFLNSADGSPDAQKTGRAAQRRAAWISLTHGGHYHAFNNVDEPRSTATYLGDLGRLMAFLRVDRNGHTIESALPFMQPAAGSVQGGHALRSKSGESERYLIFAAAGTNPSVSVETAGLSIVRLDTTTGSEQVVGTTQAGVNVLNSTGQDTAWWIE